MIELIEQTINKIDNLIKEQLPESKYQFELYDLITNTKHFRGYDEPFHWGSIYKLFVIAEIIKMSEEGNFKMDDTIELHKDIYTNGTGVITNLIHLNKLTYTDACLLVMALSDNLCSDELLNVVGFNRMNILFKNAGLTNSILSANVDTMVKSLLIGTDDNIDTSFYQSEDYYSIFNNSLKELLKNNHTNVKDINIGFEFILNEYLSEKGRSLFLRFILTRNIHTRISAYTFFSRFLLKGKTGALGFGIVNNENVAIINKKSHQIVGYFSLNTMDNIKRNFQSNDTIGLIGIEIAKLYEQLDK